MRRGLPLVLVLAASTLLAACARCKNDGSASDALNADCYEAVNVPHSSYDDSVGSDAGIVLIEADGGCSTLPDAGACSLCAQAECCAELTACPAGTSCAALSFCLDENCASSCPEVP